MEFEGAPSTRGSVDSGDIEQRFAAQSILNQLI